MELIISFPNNYTLQRTCFHLKIFEKDNNDGLVESSIIDSQTLLWKDDVANSSFHPAGLPLIPRHRIYQQCGATAKFLPLRKGQEVTKRCLHVHYICLGNVKL